MRTILFRTLAGILSLSFVWAFFVPRFADRSLRELVGFGLVSLLFGLFALFGEKPADALLELFIDFGPTKPSDDAQNDVQSDRMDE